VADYDWGPDCGCGFMQKHHRLCKDNPDYARNVAHDELVARNEALGFSYNSHAKAWDCRRGCGCVVWDVVAHIQNVCTVWNQDYA